MRSILSVAGANVEDELKKAYFKHKQCLHQQRRKIKGEEDLQLHLYKGFNLFKVMQAYYRVAVQAHNVQELPAVEELACRFSE